MRKSIEFFMQEGNIHDHLELLEMSDACLWFIDKNFKLLSFNKVYMRHMQLFANTIPNIGDRDIVLNCFPKDFADKIFKLYQKALAGEVVKIIEKGFKEDGTEADIMMIFKPVYDEDDTIIGVTCMRSDISEVIKIKKEIEDKENRIAKISWQQSHLYRGPLSTAIGLVNLLIDETSNRSISDEECTEMIAAVKEKLLEMDEVIHRITKLAALE